MNLSNQSGASRKSRGRQKVSMVKMENQSNLQVTFSKRRAGLFKKASELCTLCAAEAAIVVFSPAEKAYCFGHPSAKIILDRFSAGATLALDNPRSQLIIEAHRNSTIRELNLELTRVESLLRAEKSRAEENEAVQKAGRMQQWLPTSFDGLSYAQLCVLKESVMWFKKSLDVKVQTDMLRVDSANPFIDVSKLTLGSREFPCYPNGALGLCNTGLFGPNSSMGQATSANDHVSNDGVFYFNSGIDGSSSSAELKDFGSGGLGLNLGRDPRLY